jgi:hypothetical protein
MLFGTVTGRLQEDGALIKDLCEKYNMIKHLDGINMGWELINRHFNYEKL